MSQIVRVGTGIMLKKGNKILLGKRHLDKVENGMSVAENMLKETWTMPGGKLNVGETIFECVKRETFEETGINVLDATLLSIEDANEDSGYFLTIGFVSENFEGEVIDKEPHKIHDWQWFDMDNLPAPLFKPSEKMIEHYKKNQVYFYTQP